MSKDEKAAIKVAIKEATQLAVAAIKVATQLAVAGEETMATQLEMDHATQNSTKASIRLVMKLVKMKR